MSITRTMVREELRRYYKPRCGRKPPPNANILEKCFDNRMRAWEATGDDINKFWWMEALPSLLTTKDMRASNSVNHLVARIFANRRSKQMVDEFRTVVLASAQLKADDPRSFKRVEKFVLEQFANRRTAAPRIKAASKRSRKTPSRKKARRRRSRAA